MNTRPQHDLPGRSLKRGLALAAVTLLLVVGLFMASVFLPPQGVPAQALIAPGAAASPAAASKGVSGTIASFTAMIPELVTVSLPLMLR
jgi:hypothetical protein